MVGTFFTWNAKWARLRIQGLRHIQQKPPTPMTQEHEASPEKIAAKPILQPCRTSLTSPKPGTPPTPHPYFKTMPEKQMKEPSIVYNMFSSFDCSWRMPPQFQDI